MRIGLGEDSHRLVEGGPLRLGGIDIPHARKTIGHSDADALLHAVTDALLGAAGLDDIGQLFPDSALENRGRDSAEMLKQAYRRIREEGFEIVNLDCVVHVQAPKISPHKSNICRRIGEILEISPDRVNVKAKTGEGVGPIGQQQVIQVRCVALLDEKI